MLIYFQYFVSVLKAKERKQTEAFFLQRTAVSLHRDIGIFRQYSNIFYRLSQETKRVAYSVGEDTFMLKASGKSVRSSSIFTADVEKGLAFDFLFPPMFHQ